MSVNEDSDDPCFEQAFASYNAALSIERPDSPLESEPIN